jgi:UDP-glucose-4-epimerase GalE
MRILVTGGAGYIGSHAVRHFREQGHDVLVFDNLSLGHVESLGKTPLVIGDLGDRDALERLFAMNPCDAVVHFAGVASIAESIANPLKYFRQNVAHTINLLEAMVRHEVRRLVVSSSCTIYGNASHVPIDEDALPRPVNPYGRSKLAMEWAIADCAAAANLGYVALRYFNAAGAHPSGELGEDHAPETHLIPLALQVAQGLKSHLSILGTDYPTPDGSCIRDYIHVDDLARAHLAALEFVEPGKSLCCNLGTGRGYSVRDVVAICEEVTGRAISVEASQRRPGDPPELVAAVGRASSLLGWRPQYADLREIVQTAWNWHVRNPGGYCRGST